MSFNICKVKNIDTVSHTYCGQEITSGSTYQIQDSERIAWTINDNLLEDITNDKAQIWDSSSAISSYSDQIDWLKNNDSIPKDTAGHPVYHYPAFAEKTLPDGSKLYKRLHGQIESLDQGSNDIIFVVPHGHVKMIGARIVGAEVGDYCDFRVLDCDDNPYVADPYFGTANAVLNQYGYGVAIAPDNHQEVCRYDADMYYGMQIKFTYNSVSAKTVGFNFDMSEVVAPS